MTKDVGSRVSGRFPFGLVGLGAGVALAGTVAIPFLDGIIAVAVGIVVVTLTVSVVVGDVLVVGALASSGVLRVFQTLFRVDVFRAVARARAPRRPLVLVALLALQTLSVFLLLAVFVAAYANGAFHETTGPVRLLLTSLFAVIIMTNTSLLWFQSLFFRDIGSTMAGEDRGPSEQWSPEDNFMFELGYVSRSGQHVLRRDVAKIEEDSTMFYSDEGLALGDQNVRNLSGRFEEPGEMTNPTVPPGTYAHSALPALTDTAASIVSRARQSRGAPPRSGGISRLSDGPRSALVLTDRKSEAPGEEKLVEAIDRAFQPPK